MIDDGSLVARATGTRGLAVGIGVALAAVILWTAVSTWTEIATVGSGVASALWMLPLMISLHLVQLLLSSVAWRSLLAVPAAGPAVYFRLRLIREAIDSLFPVAQVGGEVLAARLLAQRGAGGGQAGASVIVDVSLEVVSQVGFLLTGVVTLAALGGGGRAAWWLGPLVLGAGVAGAFLLAQRFGLLRLLEALASRIGAQFPALGVSLSGIEAAAAAIYRRRPALIRATLLHWLSWSLGTLETWMVLWALGTSATLAQALVVESLGMAARTAGFAIPGALAVQEGGFALAAVAVGLPESAGLALSLVKRVREVVVGIAGVAVFRFGRSAGES